MQSSSLASNSNNAPHPINQQPEEEKKELTLYEQFGGDAKMEAFVNDIMDAFMEDEDL